MPLALGESNNATAKMLGINPQTLKKWMEERHNGFDKIRESLNDKAEKLGIKRESSCGEAVPESAWTPKRTLSLQEIRDLCEEFEQLLYPTGGIRWRSGGDEIVYCGTVFTGTHEERKKRIEKIKEQIGMDAIEEYREKKKLEKRIDDLEGVVTGTNMRCDLHHVGILLSLGLSLVAIGLSIFL